MFGKTVTIVTARTDRYGREVGKVIADRVDANLVQLRSRLARHYRRYAHEQLVADRGPYAQAEADARKARRGPWHDAQPTAAVGVSTSAAKSSGPEGFRAGRGRLRKRKQPYANASRRPRLREALLRRRCFVATVGLGVLENRSRLKLRRTASFEKVRQLEVPAFRRADQPRQPCSPRHRGRTG